MDKEKAPPDTNENFDDILNFIMNIPLFDNLSKDELSVVARQMVFKTLEAEDVLFNEWDKADYVCFIESGELDVKKKSGPDQYEVQAILKRGRSIGEMSIIDNFPRSSTVKARTKTRIAVFTRYDFEKILGDRVDIGVKILKGLAHLLSRNLKKTSSRLADNMLPLG